MSNNNFFKEKVISNFISLNPTGTLQLDQNGSFKLNGPVSKIMTPEEIAKQNLTKSNSNTFICNQNQSKIENFENYNLKKKLEKKIEEKSNKNIIIYLVIILLILILIYLFIYKKRKI
jgi:hypothetical protein